MILHAPSPTPMTLQQIFDHVGIHMLEQGKRAFLQGTGCVYHQTTAVDDDGIPQPLEKPLACAAGCLFPLGKGPQINGCVSNALVAQPLLENVGHPQISDFRLRDPYSTEQWQILRLVGELQALHDDLSIPPAEWRRHLVRLAKQFNLDPSNVDSWMPF